MSRCYCKSLLSQYLSMSASWERVALHTKAKAGHSPLCPQRLSQNKTMAEIGLNTENHPLIPSADFCPVA